LAVVNPDRAIVDFAEDASVLFVYFHLRTEGEGGGAEARPMAQLDALVAYGAGRRLVSNHSPFVSANNPMSDTSHRNHNSRGKQLHFREPTLVTHNSDPPPTNPSSSTQHRIFTQE